MDVFKLIDYFDVWGNEEDGWEVNDLCTLFDDLHLTEDVTDKDIIDYLYSIEYLSGNNPDDYEVLWTDRDFCEIFLAENQYPICRLERVAA